MSRIPAPAYSDYNSNSYRLNMMGNDDFSDGMGYGSADQDPQVAQYIQYMHRYESMLLSYRQSHMSDPQTLATIDQYLATSRQYLASVGDTDWDPMMDFGGYGPMPGYGDGAPTDGTAPVSSANPGLTMDWQDSQKVIYGESEEVPSYTADKQVSQPEVHFYNYGEMTFNVPGAASCNVAMEGGVMVATVTWPATGATKKYYFHNNEKVNFTATDADRQINIADASIPAGKASKANVGADTDTSQGTPSDEPHLWNSNNTVDYTVPRTATAQTEEDEVYCDTFNFQNDNRMNNVAVQKEGPSEYELTVTKPDGTVLRKIHLHQVDQINIQGVDAENITYVDTSGPGHVGIIQNWSEGLDSKIQVGSSDASTTTRSSHPDATQPDATHNDESGIPTDYYNTSTDVENYVFDTNSPNIDIQAPGTITLHGASFGDKAQVESYDALAHTWTIKLYKDGIRDAAHTKTITVHGDAHTKVILDVMGESSLVDTSDANKAGVQIGLEGASDSSDTSSETPQMIQSLLDAIPGLTENDLLTKITHFLVGKGLLPAGSPTLTMAQLKDKMDQGVFPPAGPDGDLIDFIRQIDPVFDNTLNSATTWDEHDLLLKYTRASNELVRVLKILYPATQIDLQSPGDGDWKHANDIKFGSQHFSYTNENNGHTIETNFQWF